MEYQYNKAKKESKKIISFSEQQLLDCAVEEGENGCDGGKFLLLFLFFKFYLHIYSF